jgi:SAM-dependent methyltransferase
MPEVYTHGHNESVLRSHAWRTAENSAAYLLPHLSPGQRLLDVGCGAGTITTGFARYVPGGHITGVDAGPSVIDQARAAVAAAAGSGGEEPLRNVDFATGDVYALDFPDDSFDVTHAHQVLQHLGDPVRALTEMRRVTKPGGIVAVRDADYAAMFWYPLIDELEEWRNLYRAVARGNGGEPDAARRLHVWARAAGLADLTVSSSTWTYSTPEERDWWGGTWADRTVKPPYSDGVVDGGYATAPDLDRIADAWRSWAADDNGWFCVVNGELLARVPA